MLMNRGFLISVVLGVVGLAILAVFISGLATLVYADGQSYSEVLANFTRVSVSGYAELSYAPDMAVASFVALGYGETAAEALDECASKMDAIISAIEALGISRGDMETSGINVRPRYDWEQKPPRIIDYEASYTLRVKVSRIDLVGKVIDAAFSAGADGMHGLYFTLSEDKKAELYSRAIQLAVENAMMKAETIASTLGLRILRVESVSLAAQQPAPIIVRELSVYEGKAEVPIMPGEGKLSASVTLTCILA